MAGARIPEGTFYLPLCLGGVLIAVFSLHHLFAGTLFASTTIAERSE
jgi:TRAP-type C4-dicarboxylate transport system permease small subunit